MRNIKLTIAYDGTRYSGWQFQTNGISIQEVLQTAIKNITGKRVKLTGSGRTDAGVHAEGQVANFKTASKIPLKKLQMGLNRQLAKDIVILKAEEAPISFDSQRSARSKLYLYTIYNNDFVDPLIKDFAVKCFYDLDIADMRRAAAMLKGKHDFKSFQAKDAVEKKSVRTLKNIRIAKEGDLVYIHIEANGFLYNMVRIIVGTLIDVGRGKISCDEVKSILLKKDRRFAGPTMPAKGLRLIGVKY